MPAKNSSSTNALSNPDIGSQSSPSAREAIMKLAPSREPFRNAAICDPAGLSLNACWVAGFCGKVFSACFQKSISQPIIAVIRAFVVRRALD